MSAIKYQVNSIENSNTVFNTETLLNMWIHGKTPASQRAYMRVAIAFIEFNEISLDQINLKNIQDFADSISHLSQNSQKTYLSIIKSLLTFIHNLGITRFNPGKAIKPPKSKDALNERILSEKEVVEIIEATTNPRDQLMLETLYLLGLRASELCNARVRDLVERKQGGQLTVFGKGGKTRIVLMPPELFEKLKIATKDKNKSDFIFISRKKTQFCNWSLNRILKQSATKAKIKNISPHWLRHAHASHSLENGANINVVSKSLGHASLETTSRYLHNRPDAGSALFLKFPQSTTKD